MDSPTQLRYTAFDDARLLATGAPLDVATAVKRLVDDGSHGSILIFDDATGRQIDLDLRGSVQEVVGRLPAEATNDRVGEAPRGPGRPKLGVVGREVTLLPRHWEWLSSQPGGASVALRKLVEDARKTNRDADRVRQSQEAAYRFMTSLAGDLTGYEEATRALYAGDAARFEAHMASWPTDVRTYATQLASAAFTHQ